MTFKRNISVNLVPPLPINHPPVLDPIGNKTIDEGKLLEFIINATDPDGDEIFYQASGLPSGAQFITNIDLNTGQRTASFIWRPGFDESSRTVTKANIVTFIVEDGKGGVDSEQISIIVQNVNRAPVLSPIGNKTIRAGKTLSFVVEANDLDKDPLRYSISNTPRGAFFLKVKNMQSQGEDYASFSWTPELNQTGEYRVTFSVNDGELSDSQIVTVDVTGGPQASRPRVLYLFRF